MRTILASACVLIVLSATASAVERTIRVAGEGKATAPPDMATIQAGVTSRAPTAADALTANNRSMTAVLATLKDQGIVAKDVLTTNLSIRPIQRVDNQGRMLNEIVTYEVTNQVRVNVRDLTKLGAALDAVVKSGANNMSAVNFGFTGANEVQDKARKLAIDDAKRRAKLYADQAGVKLGKVLAISEQPIYREPIFSGVGGGLADAEVSRVPIAPGEEEVHMQVYVEFALED